MKNIVFIILCLFSSICCSKQHIDIDNFNILIEDNVHRIDFVNGVYEVFDQSASFKPSKEDIKKVVNYLYENDALLKNKDKGFCSYIHSLPVLTTKITIVNKEDTSIITYCDPCYYPFNFITVAKADKLVTMIENICQKNENVRKLPYDFYLE
ncbi:hypothetical protein P1X15_19515 [Runella sp. MFBS21]|uniref:hypothetical protein n=1 Tax=Runella sp. MFBS21 TaxID=3034018 RepID=UPI0023F7B1B9|nr:hypothetical protein [Runella sp. MFBS21]MDF7819819.1 hypothetical protein [Runella sp. MFBS21]